MKNTILIFFALFSVCDLSAQQFPDRHSTAIEDSWMSCTMTESPNKVREEGHWIMYDFGNEYTLQGTTLWNINAYQHTDKGVQELVIDYSIDGIDWIELDYHTMTQATSSSYYQGEEGPSFGGLNARYVLITSLSNYGHSTCHGLSEVRFQATIASTTDTEELDLANQNISVSPNPFVKETRVTFTTLRPGKYNYYLTDITGKQVQQGNLSIDSDQSSDWMLRVNNIAAGSYILNVNYGNLLLSKQIQVIK